jgi:hypothetical protein
MVEGLARRERLDSLVKDGYSMNSPPFGANGRKIRDEKAIRRGRAANVMAVVKRPLGQPVNTGCARFCNRGDALELAKLKS